MPTDDKSSERAKWTCAPFKSRLQRSKLHNSVSWGVAPGLHFAPLALSEFI
jgi:hypothetical protein